MFLCLCFLFFFFNDTATTEIYTLSLHDALPIFHAVPDLRPVQGFPHAEVHHPDRKSTRLNSSHQLISYAVFCLKKKNKTIARSLTEDRCLTEMQKKKQTTPR